MNILLCGADGFIGRALEQALIAGGHTVRRAVRRPSRPGDVAVDFRRDVEPAAWLPRLDGCAAVINAVGILREVQPGDFERIHHRAPAALFAACAEAGVARVIQVSALGAQSERTGYLASKAAADRALLAALPGGVVLRPGLVFGEQGASSQLFLALASLPLVGLPGGGKQRLRPIHIDDLCAMVVALLAEQPAERVIEAVGGEELDYAQLLACYRRSLGFAPAVTFTLPAIMMSLASRAAGRFRASLLTPETWDMLRAGNTAEVAATVALLGRLPRAPRAFIGHARAAELREEMLARWRGGLLRVVVGVVWMGSGVVSLAVPTTSLELMGEFGIAGPMALACVGLASLLDIGLGVATWLRPGRRLWLAQLAVITSYSLLIAWRMPAWLIHPFAPILKNLPIIALLALLWAEERHA